MIKLIMLFNEIRIIHARTQKKCINKDFHAIPRPLAPATHADTEYPNGCKPRTILTERQKIIVDLINILTKRNIALFNNTVQYHFSKSTSPPSHITSFQQSTNPKNTMYMFFYYMFFFRIRLQKLMSPRIIFTQGLICHLARMASFRGLESEWFWPSVPKMNVL